MRIFVTGGTGFLGAAVLRQLLADGHIVAVATRRQLAGFRLSGIAEQVTAIDCDLAAARVDAAALSRFAPDVFVHLGWIGVGGGERNDLSQLANIIATGALATAAAEAGARNLIGLGSQAEYGPCDGPADESRPTRPTTLYGVAKVAAGQTLLHIAEARGLRGVWGRIYSVYGPGGDPRTLVPSLRASFANGRAPELTRCEQIWEFLHVEDAARAIVALIETEYAAGLFNIGSGAPIRLRDAVLLMRDMVAPAIEPLFGRVAYRTDQVMHLEADISRIVRITGWRPQISLASGFREL